MNIINKKVAAVVLGLGVALGAQASSWSNSSPGLVDVTANETGKTTFTYDELSGQVSIIGSPTVVASSPSIFSHVTIGNYTPTAGPLFTVVVDWTVSGAVSGGAYTFLTTTILASSTTGHIINQSEAVSTEYDVTGVPEPTQTVAGAMLLGCSGLVFAGRRMFKKQSA